MARPESLRAHEDCTGLIMPVIVTSHHDAAEEETVRGVNMMCYEIQKLKELDATR